MVGGKVSKITSMLIVFSSIIVLGSLITPAFAATVNWDGTGDGSSWFDPLNWDTDTVPLGSDDITIDNNANVDLSGQFLITTGNLTIKSGSSLFMTENSPITVLGIDGTLTNDGSLIISNEIEVTGALINNGEITIQFEFDDTSPQIFIADEQGILINNGDILVDSDTELGNFNLLVNLGNITIASDGRYENAFNTTNSAVFNIREDGLLDNSFNFTNHGTVTIEGQFSGDDSDEVILINYGKIENKISGLFRTSSDNYFENNGNFTNGGDAFLTSTVNTGLILNLQSMSISKPVSSNQNFTNHGTVELTGEIDISGNGFLRNDGQIILGIDFGGEGTDDGVISSNGIIENNNSIDILVGEIQNNDELKNYGTITNDDQIENLGSGEITNVGTITNNGIINNLNIINDCGLITGSPPIGGTLNGFCPATIIIIKDTVPNASTDFEFTSTTLLPAIFNLDDDSQGPLQNTKEFESLTPGLYNITETFEPNYITNSNCDDGSNIKSINVQNDETVTCVFTNLLDSDLDGIAEQIDTVVPNFSNDFDDEPLGAGGQTNGTITSRESLTVWITDEPNPDGVKIRAVNGPSQNATISVCYGASTISINDGDEIIVTCGSVDITTNFGNPHVLLNSLESVKASLVLPQGNKIFFDPITFKFSTPKNSDPLSILIGTQTPISMKMPANSQNTVSFKPETVTFTSDASNEDDITILIGDKQETIQPDSNVSPIVVSDQIVKTDKNQQIEITLSSIEGDSNMESIFEITFNPHSGTIIQNSEIITYIPNEEFIGLDEFQFKAIKGTKESNSGTIRIEVADTIEFEKLEINGGYTGKLSDMEFDVKGIFKIEKSIYKKVNIKGEFELIEKDSKCSFVKGEGIMNFQKGDTLNVEFNAETCKKGIISKLKGTLEFKGGTGIFDDAYGIGEFSQINLKNRMIGKMNGELFMQQ